MEILRQLAFDQLGAIIGSRSTPHMRLAHTLTAALALCVMVLVWFLSRSEMWRNHWLTRRLSDLLLLLVVGLVVWYFAQR